MASAIGDGLLGFIAGAAGGAAQGEQQKFQSQLQLDRQLSLLQAQRAFAEEDNAALQQQLFDSLPEEQRESLNIESPEDTARFTTQEGQLLTQTVAQQQQEQRKREEAERLDRATRAFFEGNATSEQKSDLVRNNVLDVDELQQESDQPSEEEIQGIMSSAGIGRNEAVALIKNPSLGSTILSNKGRGSGSTTTVSIRDNRDGTIRELPKNQAVDLLAQTNEDGTPRFESGERKLVDGEFFFVTNNSITPIGSEAEPDEQLSPREQFERRVEVTTNQESFRKNNLEGVNPSELGLDLIDASGGPVDSGAETLGALGIGDTLGQRQVQASNALRDIRSQIQTALNIGSRPLSAILENVFEQVPVPSGLGALAPGRDKFTRASLEQARRSVRRTIESAETVASDEDVDSGERGEARAVQVRMEKVLGSMNTLIADDDISKMKVPVVNPQTGRKTTENLTSLDTFRQLRAIDLNSLSERQKNLVTLWGMKLRFDQGFN